MTSERILLTALIICVVAGAVAFAFSEQKKNRIIDKLSLTGSQKRQLDNENIFNLKDAYQGRNPNFKKGAIKPISLQFSRVKNFSEGLAAVSIGEKWGFINLENVLVIPAIYQDAKNFKQGKANVKFNGKWILINKLGQQIKTNETL